MRERCAAPIDARPVEDPLCHYVVVRGDLPVGVIAAQIVHAAGESALEPVPPDTFAVVLSVKSEEDLRAVAARLSRSGIEHRVIVETDGPHAGQAMTIGCRPARRSVIRKYLSSLPLYGRVAQSRAPGSKPDDGGSRPPSPTNSSSSHAGLD